MDIMTELLKLFLSKLTMKSAVIFIVGVILLLIMWPFIQQLFTDMEIPHEYQFILAFATTSVVAFLVVSLLMQLIKAMKNCLDSCRNTDVFKKSIDDKLPHLDKDKLKLLNTLIESKQTVNLSEIDSKWKWFIAEGWVYKGVELPGKMAILAIAPDVKTRLIEYNSCELIRTVESLTKLHKEFLSLFWLQEIPYGTQASGERMPHGIYCAGCDLIGKRLLWSKTSDVGFFKEFSLSDEAEKVLKDKVFMSDPKLKAISLDLNYVMGSGASGAGATGSTFKGV